MHSSMRISWLLMAVLVALGCDGSPRPASSSPKLNILATVYPLADIARQVGGANVEVSWIVESGQSLDGVTPTPEIRSRLHSADLVLSGGASEQWASEGFNDPFQHGRILRLDIMNAARDQTEGGLLWLDPVVMQEACRELGARLQVLRPQDYKAIQERTDAYAARLNALYQQYQDKLLTPQTRKLLMFDNDFMPLLKRLGLEGVNSVPGSPTNLNPANVRLLKQVSQQEKTRLLVISADIPAAVIQDIEQRTGMQIVVLDALGSSAAGGRNSYLELLRFNFEQLLRATTIQ